MGKCVGGFGNGQKSRRAGESRCAEERQAPEEDGVHGLAEGRVYGEDSWGVSATNLKVWVLLFILFFYCRKKIRDKLVILNRRIFKVRLVGLRSG